VARHLALGTDLRLAEIVGLNVGSAVLCRIRDPT